MKTATRDQDTTPPLLKSGGGETKSNAIEVPSISLPKGGGAIKGIDETFQVNPANGTSSLSIPLPLSPNRNGFTPQLSLSYNSGVGNGPFGIGWDLGLPSIQRRTDKQLPRYLDSNDPASLAAEDSFMFSGVEELVPFMDWRNEQWEIRQEQVGDLTIRQYRPRIEGGFSRIERIHHADNGYYWRVTSNGNVTTFFGYSPSCRIADPTDRSKVFQWLPEFSFDDKGSWVRYNYKAEDLDGVANDVQEKNRFKGLAPFVNQHLKRIQYGNATPYFVDESNPYHLQFPTDDAHFFELVLDYGEHDPLNPSPDDTGFWAARKDPFSDYRACFEQRSYRLCRRALMFHRFPELNGGQPTLVRSLDFDHSLSDQQATEQERPAELTYLTGITQIGYVRTDEGYSRKALPRLSFDYEWLRWDTEPKSVSSESLVHAPVGLSANYQWTDLYNEGINGILSEQANGWFYKSNLGADDKGNVRFTHAKPVIPKPSLTGLSNGVLQLQDLEANGERQLVVNYPGLQGYFELTDEGEWQPFKAFLKTLNLDFRDPNVRMLDVNGDGRPEVLLSDHGAFWWWENAGKIGYDAPELATKPFDEERGAAIVFSDFEQRIFLADMSGDGLTDIVRIRNGEVCYWPNLGYGRFGAKVVMGNAPVFDTPELFNPDYLQLADISGTGATDLIYLGKNRFTAYLNLSGNAWSDATEIAPFFPTEQPNQITVTDLLGNGTACIVWSSPLPAHAHAPMRYIDLIGGKKPHLLRCYENGMGKRTELAYKSSTHFYLQDKAAGRPWATKLPFPVHCVSKSTATEAVTGVRFTAEYSYHHGHYDHAEREFRGFGRVEQTDAEDFGVFSASEASNAVPEAQHQPPVLTKTWFHTGAFMGRERILNQFKNEYWQEEFRRKGFSSDALEHELPDAQLLAADKLTGFDLDTLSVGEWQEALRACKGMTLRQEVFGLDAEKRIADEQRAKGYTGDDPAFLQFQAAARRWELLPYSVATHNCEIQLLQGRGSGRYGVFLVQESEAISYVYERNPEDPRIAHTLNIEKDELGNVLESVSVVYPRRQVEPLLQDVPGDDAAALAAKAAAREAQKRLLVTFTKNELTNDLLSPSEHYLRKAWQARTYELTGMMPTANIFNLADFKGKVQGFQEIAYHEKPTPGIAQKRLIEHIKTKFYDAELTAPLPDGQQAARSIPFEAYQLAYTPELLADIYQPSPFSAPFTVSNADMEAGRFLLDDGKWWVQSGTAHFRRAGEGFGAVKGRFFAPVAYTDPFDSVTEVFYDDLHFFMQRSVDALGNEQEVLRFNFRTLSPDIMRDMNDNITSVVTDELGLVKAAATEGKANGDPLHGEEGDNLLGLTEQTAAAEAQLIADFFDAANAPAPQVSDYGQLQSIARQLLGSASVRVVYDFTRQPSVAASIVREQHANVTPNSPLQISFEYSDGLGRVAMQKVQAEPGRVTLPDGSTLDTGSQLRWVGNGRTVLNNKGNPIRQYEPYFSTTPAYEDDPAWVERGVSPTLFYDGAGRNVRTEMPDGTFTKIEFDAWLQAHYDPNDTVLESVWYQERMAMPPSDPRRQAARQTEAHTNTPSHILTDTLSRPVLGIDHNRWRDAQGNTQEALHYTFSELDIEGNALSLTDARGNQVMAWRYDMLGHQVAQVSMDAGRRWVLNNALGNPVKTWDERRHEFLFEYDALHRPTKSWVSGGDGASPLNHCYGLVSYGENLPDGKALNLRGRAAIAYDTAGKTISESHDFKGNLLLGSRIFARDYKNTPHWDVPNPDDLLEGSNYSFRSSSEYDALNRATRQTTPDRKTTLTGFNPAGMPEKISLQEGDSVSDYVRNIDYDEKGQRTRIQYGNGVTTRYDYDPLSFRLVRLLTTSGGGSVVLQDLNYTYDPTGNITQIEDAAVPVVFFNNQKITGQSAYEYDALYRLISASGREQNTNSPNFDASDNWNDAAHVFSHNSGDPMAMRNYTQRYQYDAVGNILQMRHEAGANGSWTRDYRYESANNRLVDTTVGSQTYAYPHHAQHGYMERLPHLQSMAWTFKEELQATSKHALNDGAPETTYYVYDGSGQRARKITERAVGGAFKEERVYMGGFEVFRQADGLERETLHVAGVALLETRTKGSDETQRVLTRYQLGNHLGSVSLELDENATLISYEEYHPYGTTAYQARNASIKAAAKRYRYTGMERDEETGMAYHSARYYLTWLGRWGSADPIGVEGGMNLYVFSGKNPINRADKNGNQPTGHITGEVGELLVDQLLDDSGYYVFRDWSKSVTQSGIDSIAFNPKTKELLWIDNKAYSGPIGGASALEENFAINRQRAIEFLRTQTGTEAAAALKAIEEGREARVIANGMSGPNSRATRGLFAKGIRFMDVFSKKISSTYVAYAEAKMSRQVLSLAASRGMRIRNQRGFAKIEVINGIAFIAIATAAGVILASEDKLDAVLQTLGSIGSDIAIGAIFTKLTKSSGMGALLTMVVGMESDNAQLNEARAKQRMIDSFVCENFKEVCTPYYYSYGWFGRSSTKWEGDGTPEYWNIYKKVENLINDPYKFESIPTPNWSKDELVCIEIEDEIGRMDCFQNIPRY